VALDLAAVLRTEIQRRLREYCHPGWTTEAASAIVAPHALRPPCLRACSVLRLRRR
jgi:hypothetical protein